MALVNLMRKVSLPPTLLSMESPLLTASVAAINIVPVRSYMKNFFNDKTAIKPARGWMHQDREMGPGNRIKRLRLAIKSYSEIKRQRKFSYEARMKTEGGRRIIMRRILMGRDHLSG